MRTFTTSDDYAHDFKGTAMYTLDLWRHFFNLADATRNEAERNECRDKAAAFADILAHITGTKNEQEWAEKIRAM